MGRCSGAKSFLALSGGKLALANPLEGVPGALWCFTSVLEAPYFHSGPFSMYFLVAQRLSSQLRRVNYSARQSTLWVSSFIFLSSDSYLLQWVSSQEEWKDGQELLQGWVCCRPHTVLKPPERNSVTERNVHKQSEALRSRKKMSAGGRGDTGL